MRRQLRTIQVAVLDRQMACSEAIRRAVDAGARSALITSCERIVDPHSGKAVWEIVVSVPRQRLSRR